MKKPREPANVQGSLAKIEAIAMRITENCRRYLLRHEIGNRPPVHPQARVFLLIAILLPLLLSSASTAFAGSATWNLNPISGVWNTATNWTPPTVPNGPNDTATFGVSNSTSIANDSLQDIEVNGIVFDPGASAFTIAFGNSSFNDSFTISGVGITNNSGITQNFEIGDFGYSATFLFTNSATAGDQTVFTAGPNCCGTSNYVFQDTSTAGNATLIANSDGTIVFTGDSTGGTAGVGLDRGSLDISTHNGPGVTVRSIEGSGTINLGANNLTVDSNFEGKVFSGVIQDNGAGGSFTKQGRRRLVLANANTYRGGTTIRGGDLFVNNQTGSATGRGVVHVAAGALGGDGIIVGPVTVGTASGSRSRAELLPGDKGVLGTLSFLNTLTFNSHGAYLFDVNSDEAIADQVIAHGVTIKSATTPNFFITDLASGILKNAELYDSGNETWSATGNLTAARSGHTATLLPNGKVLVAGGEPGLYLSLSSAELYDPATGTWTATGSLTTARSGQTATLLPSGKVLIAGGNTGVGPMASAELYDPASGIWTPTGNMTSARYYHTATLLANGKVLVVGSPGVATAELYDPASGSWTSTSSPITSRWSHTATLLPNGKVLVAGGSSGIGSPIELAELYDPTTESWAATGNLHKARQVHAATLLLDGKVLVVGGQGPPYIHDLRSAELYDPATGTWMDTGVLATRRSYHTATLLTNGKVMAVGGNNAINFMEPSVELYDPASGTWTTTDSLDTGRYGHTASLLPDGKVLVAGGVGQGLPLGTVFTVISNTSAMPISGTFFNLPDGSTISVGGKNCQVSYSGGDGNDLTLTVVP